MEDTKQKDYPNMPKYQPCPECNRNSKRNRKTITGAIYYCSTHGEFVAIGKGDK